MRPLSIKLRLSLLVSLVTLAVILTVSIVAYVELEESLLGNVDEVLRAMGEGVLAAFDKNENPQARAAEFQSILGTRNVKDPAWYRVWMDESDQDLFAGELPNDPYRELFLHPPGDAEPEVGESSFFNIISDADRDRKQACRAVWMRRVFGQQVVNILVGRSSHYVYHELGEFYRLLLIVGASLMLLTFLLVPVFVAWGLGPIARASAQLRTITHKSLGQEKVFAARTAPELQPFVAALEEMLSRLDKAMRQQEQFIADAAHELRTPVAIIKSTLQTTRLLHRAADEYEQSIDETLEDIGRLEHLIEQLLSLARLEGVDRLQEPARVRLDALLNGIVRMFEARAAQQGGRVIFSEAACTWVRGDEHELRQLFGNLLDNAVRYGPPGGTVRVTLENSSDRRVTVTVHDDGGRIPPDALAHLFDRFYRVDSSRSQASGGSGLGLAIAREIALRHDGNIAITSDPQTGTSVIVHLPRL
jgi:two-component system heavy metal sensor histidine kinase CusS